MSFGYFFGMQRVFVEWGGINARSTRDSRDFAILLKHGHHLGVGTAIRHGASVYYARCRGVMGVVGTT